jgi:glycosyltransferase involved in cell wall biosynthesis
VIRRGLYERVPVRVPREAEPLIVFAGRHIPEKRPTAVVPAVMRAREQIPGLRGVIFGDGPEHASVRAQIAAEGKDAPLTAPGFASADELADALSRALCLVLPSSREGLGTVVMEAAAMGVPSVVVEGADNGSTELIEPGRNGFIAPSAAADDLCAAFVAVHAAGDQLRAATHAWYLQHARELSLDGSIDAILDLYRAGRPR